MTVSRFNIGPRFSVQHLGDGTQIVCEGVEYRASCGCVATFGIRADNKEKTLCYASCEKHTDRSHDFLNMFAGAETPEIPTEEWMAICLEAIE